MIPHTVRCSWTHCGRTHSTNLTAQDQVYITTGHGVEYVDICNVNFIGVCTCLLDVPGIISYFLMNFFLDMSEIANRITHYITGANSVVQLPVAEAMVTYKEKR